MAASPSRVRLGLGKMVEYMRSRHFFALATLLFGVVAAASAQFSGPAPLAWRWANPTSVPPLGTPIVSGNVVYVAVGNRMFGLDKETGNQRWRFPLVEGVPGFFRSSPVLVGGTLAAAADNQLVYGVDPAYGTSKWQYVAAVPIVGQPVAAGNFLVFQMSDNTLMAVNGADGQPAWPGPYRVFNGLNGGMAAHGDNLIYMTQANEIICLSVNTQRVLWTKRLSVILGDSWPIVFGDNLYLNSGTWVVAMSAVTGSVRWQQNIGDQLSYSPAVSPDGVFVSNRDGQAFLLDTSSGRPKVRTPIELGSVLAVRPSAVDRMFLAPTTNGALNLIDPKTGEIVWSYLVRPLLGTSTTPPSTGAGGTLGGAGTGRPGGGQSSPQPILTIPASGAAVLIGTTLFVQTQDGSLLAFDSGFGVDKTGPAVKMVWPMPGDVLSGQPPLEFVFKIDDEATGVNAKTLKITVGGQEMDHEFGRDGYAIVRVSVLGKNKPLFDGRKPVVVTVSDWIGNRTVAEYSVTVDNTLRPVPRPTSTTPAGGAGAPGRGGLG